jgi:hypothetical protein
MEVTKKVDKWDAIAVMEEFSFLDKIFEEGQDP